MSYDVKQIAAMISEDPNIINEANRPGSSNITDRSLEAFRPALEDITAIARGVINPQAKQEIMAALVPFIQQMKTICVKYKNQGVGYSQRQY